MRCWSCLGILLTVQQLSAAVSPSEVFIVVNQNEPKSREIATLYCELRKVPPENVIPVDVLFRDDITRADFESKIVAPLRTALTPHRQRCRVILTTLGIPLRVGPETPSDDEQKQLVSVRADLQLKRHKMEVERRTVTMIEEEVKRLNLPNPPESIAEHRKELEELQKHVRELEEMERRLMHAESEAAVDSELMLIWWPNYPKPRWVINPIHWQVTPDLRRRLPQTVMTCRLDGPNVEVAKRLITDAVAVEKEGLKGKVYVDARGIKFDAASDPTGIGLAGYDESMREMAHLLNNQARLAVTLEDTPALFLPHSCPDTALYCGWYSLKAYVPSFKFNRGAVAWHLASFEMLSLKNPGQQWCGGLLHDGVCATLGAVAEPYTVAFPKPAEFFGVLATGELTLVESYAGTAPLASWMMCLVGDPLYTPYRADKRMKIPQVLPSPKGSKFFLGQ